MLCKYVDRDRGIHFSLRLPKVGVK